MAAEITKNWYKEMSVYQIWPRSFCDGNGDGIGDLQGVLSKLDYIKSLGVDAIWFSPLYVSPQKDYGYDIADYRNIAPEYGTLEDFKAVLDGAHARGLRVIMDLVVNHTSDQHPWFLESKKGKDNPYSDYYIWRKGRLNNKLPPNDWKSTFAAPGWQFVPERNEYYLHLFATEQPDLNMDNPKVRQEVKEIYKYWLDMGVDGFREDVITFISKREGLPDGIPLPVAAGFEHYMDGPHLHEYLMEFKEVWSKYDCMTVGEAPMMTPKRALKHIAEGPEQELNMMFHFQHMEADCMFVSWLRTPFNLKKLKKVYTNWQKALYGKAWNALYIENHDQPRIINRYGDLNFREESAKMLAVMYMCQSGTPFIYQGQEIGMTNIGMTDIEKYEDVSTKNIYNMCRKFGLKSETIMKIASYASRDNARTPVQWSAEANAGFTTAEKPWFPINPNYTEVNIEAAEKDEKSVLNFYRKLIRFRKENEIVIYGDYTEYDHENDKMFVYGRTYQGKRMLVICSFCDKNMVFKAPTAYDLEFGKCAICNYDNPTATTDGCVLRPYETRVYMFD